jgi:hypothetical protein
MHPVKNNALTVSYHNAEKKEYEKRFCDHGKNAK